MADFCHHVIRWRIMLHLRARGLAVIWAWVPITTISTRDAGYVAEHVCAPLRDKALFGGNQQIPWPFGAFRDAFSDLFCVRMQGLDKVLKDGVKRA